MSMPDFLLVIPAYREHLRLPPFLAELTRVLSKADFATEILVVDDGSPDEERYTMLGAIQPGLQGQCRVLEPILLPANQGKGAAVLAGWRSGIRCRWVSFVDADGAISPEEILRLFNLAIGEARHEHIPTIFATRIRMLGRQIRRRFYRHLSGRVFATVVGNLLESHVYDTQCGFKIVPTESFQRINPLLKEAGFCFDVELLLALEHAGAQVIEVPIDWEDKAGGSVRVLRDGFIMLRQVLAICKRSRSWKNKGMLNSTHNALERVI